MVIIVANVENCRKIPNILLINIIAVHKIILTIPVLVQP